MVRSDASCPRRVKIDDWLASLERKEEPVSSNVTIKYRDDERPIARVTWNDRCLNTGILAYIGSGRFVIHYTTIDCGLPEYARSERRLTLSDAEEFLEAALRMVKQNQ